MRKVLIIALVTATQLLLGCTDAAVHIPLVYRLDIQQGNVVTAEMLGRLQPGMDKQQVTYIMGTPLVVDPFHQDQWIYLYTFDSPREPDVRRKVSLRFENERLAGIEGDVREIAAEVDEGSTGVAVDVPLEDEDRGVFRQIKDVFKREPEPAPAPAAP